MENRRKQQSVDGLVLRRNSNRTLGASNLHEKPGLPDQFLQRNTQVADTADTASTGYVNQPSETRRDMSALPAISTAELSESLRELDEEGQKPKRRFGWLTRKKVVFFILALALIFAGYFGIKIFMTSGKLFSGNIFDLLGRGQELKTDQYGRSNILVFGTSEDDPGHEDAGANLTDSIMIVSIDQKTKNAVMISVPRDLWVKYGEACMSGYEGKINVVYECGADGAGEPDGASKLMDVVGESFGLDIQYYAHVNYTVVRDTVNAVGGVTVEIDSDDPRGILDRNFDWACKYKCHYVKWPNGPANLNGDQALALARARNAAGGYGLGGGNFDREQYQQKIIVALKDKAASAGTLANPVAVSGILDALGENVRTNFSAGEVKTLITLAGEIPSSSIKRVSLVEPGKAVLTTGNVSGQSVVRPVAGLFSYGEMQRFVRQKLTISSNAGEEPKVEVLNGSDFMGVAGEKAAELTAAGFNDVSTGDTDSSSAFGEYVWYDLSGGKKPQSLTKLKSILGSSPTGTVLPGGVQSEADFVIIVGNGAN
ncbi:MAG: LCP family protein [Candidatus Saccharimonadales bacterium]